MTAALFDLVERSQLQHVDAGSQPSSLHGEEPKRRALGRLCALAELGPERLSDDGADRLALDPGASFEIGSQAPV